jgi:TolB-like protein
MKNPAYITARPGPAECVSIRNLPEPIPESLCRACIERIAGSVTFCRAEQLRELLKWLGDRSLAAQRTAPSEKEIAAAVLNRQDFDPQTDSLVRKEMSRLREKLSRYYLSEGLQDEIRLAAGSGYLLGFERRSNVNPESGASCWLVLPFRSSSEMAEHGEQLLEELLMAIGERGGPELVASTTALAYRGRMGDLRQFAAECRADFVVEGSLRRRNDLIEATVWLVDGQSGRARRSKRIAGVDVFELAPLVVSWLLAEDAAVS